MSVRDRSDRWRAAIAAHGVERGLEAIRADVADAPAAEVGGFGSAFRLLCVLLDAPAAHSLRLLVGNDRGQEPSSHKPAEVLGLEAERDGLRERLEAHLGTGDERRLQEGRVRELQLQALALQRRVDDLQSRLAASEDSA